jgi:glucose/arabinose dehydrogenase
MPLALLLAAACSPSQPPPAARPTPPPSPSLAATPAGPCLAAQSPAGAPGTQSSLPVVVLADGLPTAEDLLVDGDRLLIGQYSTGRINALGDQPLIHQLPGTVPEVEGMARLGGTLYVADQLNDRVVTLAPDGSVSTFLQLTPVRGVEGLDQITTDGQSLIVPDSAHGTVLWAGTDGTVQRSVGGFARPTGAWPVPDGSVLVSDENGGHVYSIAAGGARSVVASGLPLDDDVARTSDGRIYTISITLAGLFEVTAGGAVQAVATGLAQPQGLEIDHAGNPIVTEYDRGRVEKVVESFALLAPAGPVTLGSNQPLCVQVARAPGFSEAVTIDAGNGYRVTMPPGSGSQGEILPAPCGQPECSVQVSVRAGDRTDATWLRYRGGS